MQVGIVLFHGAGLGSWLWDDVVAALDLPALAIDLPGRAGVERPPRLALEDCADRVVRQLEDWGPTRFVLGAHSVSGGLALRVATKLGDRVAGVAMIGAGVPEDGRSYDADLPWLSRTLLRTMYFFVPEGLQPPPGVLKSALCNDLDPASADAVAQRAVLPIPRLFTDPVRWTLHPETRRLYVALTDDASDLTPALQRTFASRLGGDLLELPTGHLPMLSRPAELAGALADLASAPASHPES